MLLRFEAAQRFAAVAAAALFFATLMVGAAVPLVPVA